MKKRFSQLLACLFFCCLVFFGLTKNSLAGSWNATGNLDNGQIFSLALYNNELYAAGFFYSIDDVSANSIAKWNGSSWSAVGSGVSNNNIYCLAVYNNELYVGGNFSTAGGVSANNIAKWNGSSWSAVGSGVNDNVSALTAYKGELYAGGIFTTAGGNTATGIAKWNGSSWSAVDSGVDDHVNALAVYNNELYVGGLFTTAGDIQAYSIAKWNGLMWSTLGSLADGEVSDFAVYNNELYVGGSMSTAGGVSVSNIARWNTSSWDTVGSGINGLAVASLATYNNELYAGGYFTIAGGVSANNIAKWDGSSWSAVGSGISGIDEDTHVGALTVYNDELYVGGNFTLAGDIEANSLAKWSEDMTAPTTTTSPVGGTYTSSQIVTLTATDEISGVTATYYTTDGTDPTTSSTQYSSPITISETTTLKFFSIDNAGNFENVKTEYYIIDYRLGAENNLKNGRNFVLKSDLEKQSISGQSLTINFTKLPTKLTKNNAYWMKWNKLSGYPNKTFLKKWKMKTNLYKYKVKKSSQKYKIKIAFKFTKKQLKKYLKKNKTATKSNLYLKYKKGTGAWQNINTAFTDAKIIKKEKKFIVKYFTKYPVKTQYFAIGIE